MNFTPKALGGYEFRYKDSSQSRGFDVDKIPLYFVGKNKYYIMLY